MTKSKLKIVGINLILFALLLGLVTLNKTFIRPTFNHIPIIKFLAGCFPNFVAAFLICLAIVNAVLIRKPKFGRVLVYSSSFIVFFILTFEELKPIWGASTYYDLYDIFSSGLGALLAVLTFEIIFRKQTKEK